MTEFNRKHAQKEATRYFETKLKVDPKFMDEFKEIMEVFGPQSKEMISFMLTKVMKDKLPEQIKATEPVKTHRVDLDEKTD